MGLTPNREVNKVDLNRHEMLETYADMYYCPNCTDDDAEMYEGVLKRDYKFCPYCGISLDWGDKRK